MFSAKRLYQQARLVHGDLSEYNILVAPTIFIDNHARSQSASEVDLHAVLIDFGQAVDVAHPFALGLLNRDVDRVVTFFQSKGVETKTKEEILEMILRPDERSVHKEFFYDEK